MNWTLLTMVTLKLNSVLLIAYIYIYLVLYNYIEQFHVVVTFTLLCILLVFNQ